MELSTVSYKKCVEYISFYFIKSIENGYVSSELDMIQITINKTQKDIFSLTQFSMLQALICCLALGEGC